MKCPYCEGSENGNFINTNLSFKYKHERCNNYFKKCPVCDTIYAEADKSELQMAIEIDSIFDVDVCQKCKQWLPDLPTSWTRSFTNINKIHEVIKDFYEARKRHISADQLYKIQKSHFGVVFNPERAHIRGFESYLSGSGERRMSEYAGALRDMGILNIVKVGGYGKLFHTLSSFGEIIAESSEPDELLSSFILAFINIKKNNGLSKDQKNSPYSYFKIRFAQNLLEIIDYINNDLDNSSATKYNIGLAFLARDWDDFVSKSKKYARDFSSIHIKNLFFENDDELQRAVVSTFLNPFISMGLISKGDDNYYLSEMGKEILSFLNKRPSIWFEDLKKYTHPDSANQLFAKLLLWRLVSNELIKPEDTSLDIPELNRIVEEILSANSDDIKDLHINLYYDEPRWKKSHSNTQEILSHLKSYISEEDIPLEEITDLCESLNYIWLDELMDIVDKYPEKQNDFFDTTDETFKTTVQVGQKWHDEAKSLLQDIGFEVENYKDNKIFEDIIIDNLKILLPGGTIHNPDILILNENFGPKNCILVDAKNESSISSEVPKLVGYNIYSSHERVDSFTVIPLNGTLPDSTKNRIKNNLSEFNRITVVEKDALVKMRDSSLTKEECLDLLNPSGEFTHINSSDVVNFESSNL